MRESALVSAECMDKVLAAAKPGVTTIGTGSVSLKS